MSKDKILDAAEALFVEKGYDATSVRELAQAADVNVAMISYYFGSKESLLEAMIEKRTSQTRAKLEEFKKKELSPLELLDHIIELYVDKIFNNRKFHLMMHRELSLSQRHELHGRILNIFDKNWAEIKNAILLGQKKGLFKKSIDMDLVIMTMFGLINQCTQTKIIEKLLGNPLSEDQDKLRERLKVHLINILHDHLLIKSL